jgi:dynein heavy chain
VQEVKLVIESEAYDAQLLERASKAAAGIADWSKAIIQFHEALKVVKPRQAQLADAKAKSKKAQEAWDKALGTLDEVQKNLLAQVNELKRVKDEEAALKKQKEQCDFSLSVAEALIIGLADEKISWEDDLAAQKINNENLVGDVIICSGFIAYLGVFLGDYRDECKTNWTAMLKKYSIKSNPKVDLVTVLGDQVRISEWQINKLPKDAFSTENAIIQDNSERWSLLIDPQMQGVNWLMATYGQQEENKLVIIKPTMEQKILSRLLENALNVGYPVILVDAGETFDPMLEPIIAKNI